MNRKFNRFFGMIVTSALAVMSLGGCKNASSDLVPTPELKGLTPNVLTWAADETEPKTVEIEGTDLKDAKFILSGTTDFYTELDGTTITVTPKDVNDLDEDVINILTVSIKGGKSLTATLTQTKPIRVPNLTALTPDALTWGPEETEAKTIVVDGDYLTGKVLTVTLPESSNFTATVEGDVVTVAPKAANTTETVFEETLTVAVEGGNSLTATLTQAKPAPSLTALAPDALTWAANETEAKTIEVTAAYLAGAELTVSLPGESNFNVTVEGTTITVTPKAANTGATAFVETLTVSVEGGNSLTATLTQTPAPALTKLTPNALTWTATETEAKTVTVEGTNLDGATITATVDGSAFTATVEGTTVTVTPAAANESDADLTATLTVSVEGGNSLTATLTQTKPALVPTLTSLTPEAVVWTAAETEAKTITVAGEHLDDVTLVLSELTNFTATVSGTTITVAPKAVNATYEAVAETLSVSIEGGEPLTATLTQQAKPRPALTSLTPNALTWAATETEAKTIAVAGTNLEGETITATVEGSAFTATVEGTTVTVTPAAANEGDADVTATLTVSVADGNSLTVTLTQTKPESTGGETTTGGWTRVTEDRTDWTGTYLFVAVNVPENLRAWNMTMTQTDNQIFLTANENNVVTAAGAARYGDEIPLSDLATSYSVTITKVEGGYTIRTATGQYITNTTGAAGTDMGESEVIAANSITFHPEDNTFEISLSNSTAFGYFQRNRRFNYFPNENWGDKSRIGFFEYRE